MSANVAVLGADQAVSAVALADVPDLTMSLKAATLYSFDFTLFFKTAAVTTGLRLALNGPAASFLRWGKIVPTSLVAVRVEVATAWDAGTVEASSGGTAEQMALLHGSVLTTAAGLLVVRAAS